MIILILHIVRSGETINKIADNYQVDVSDITSNNFHITDFKNLKPGMKLKIPFLSVPIIETLEQTEPFISDYYPSLKPEFSKDNIKKEEVIIPKEEIVEKEIIPDSNKLELEEEKEVLLTPKISYSNYQGHIIPNIDSKYIRKI